MRQILLALLLLLLTAVPAKASVALTASDSGACTTANACLSVSVGGPVGAVVFTLNFAGASISATAQFEASGDNGATWYAINVTPSNSSTAVTSATASGVWQANTAGYTNVRVRLSAWSSGTVNATIQSGQASARSGGGAAPSGPAGGALGCTYPNPCTSTLAPSGTVYYATTNCNGLANCVQLTDDDTTDNCAGATGTALTAWILSINGYSGAGGPQIIFLGSGTGKGFLFQTCHMIFAPTATGQTASGVTFYNIHANATFDAGTNSAANLIQFGDAVHSDAVYDWEGGTFVGGASLTVAGFEVTNQTGNSLITKTNWINFGAGNATLGVCTNAAVQYDNWVFESTLSFNYWQVTDTTTGRCAFINAGSTVGESTVNFTGNVAGGRDGTHCASVLIQDGGSYGMMEENNLGTAGIDILLKGIGHRIIDNQLDSTGCVANTINAGIQVAGNVPAVSVIGNTGQFGASHLTALISMVGSAGSSGFQSWSVTGNSQSNTSVTTAALFGGNWDACTPITTSTTGCYAAGNQSLVMPVPCPSGVGFVGWQIGSDLSYCTSNTAGANVGSTLAFTQFNATGIPQVRVNCQVVITTQATTSSTLPQCEVTYTDAATSSSETVTVTPTLGASATVGCNGTAVTDPTVGTSCTGSVYISPKANTAVNYMTIGYASVGATAMVAKVIVNVENPYQQ